MIIEKACTYSVSTTSEENNVINNAIIVLGDIIDELNENDCDTIIDEDGCTVEIFEIERAMEILDTVLYAVKME